jgi:hypothetical protein
MHWLVMYEHHPGGGPFVLDLKRRHFTIHHKNGRRNDNRLVNLEFRAPSKHPEGWTLIAMAEIVDEARRNGFLSDLAHAE